MRENGVLKRKDEEEEAEDGHESRVSDFCDACMIFNRVVSHYLPHTVPIFNCLPMDLRGSFVPYSLVLCTSPRAAALQRSSKVENVYGLQIKILRT